MAIQGRRSCRQRDQRPRPGGRRGQQKLQRPLPDCRRIVIRLRYGIKGRSDPRATSTGKLPGQRTREKRGPQVIQVPLFAQVRRARLVCLEEASAEPVVIHAAHIRSAGVEPVQAPYLIRLAHCQRQRRPGPAGHGCLRGRDARASRTLRRVLESVAQPGPVRVLSVAGSRRAASRTAGGGTSRVGSGVPPQPVTGRPPSAPAGARGHPHPPYVWHLLPPAGR